MRLTDDAGPEPLAPHDHGSNAAGPGWSGRASATGKSDIFARCADGDGWHDPVQRQRRQGQRLGPRRLLPTTKKIASGSAGTATNPAHYSVRVRSLSGGPKPKLGEDADAGEVAAIRGARPSLACDRDGRLWAGLG